MSALAYTLWRHHQREKQLNALNAQDESVVFDSANNSTQHTIDMNNVDQQQHTNLIDTNISSSVAHTPKSMHVIGTNGSINGVHYSLPRSNSTDQLNMLSEEPQLLSVQTQIDDNINHSVDNHTGALGTPSQSNQNNLVRYAGKQYTIQLCSGICI